MYNHLHTVCVQILVKEVSKPWYHFLTTTCAIIGGERATCLFDYHAHSALQAACTVCGARLVARIVIR